MRRVALLLLVLLAGCYPDLDWREFAWPEGGFSILLPAKPAKSSREVVLGGEKLQLEMLSVQAEGLAFGVGYAKLRPGNDQAILSAARDALLANIGGKIVSEREVDIRGTAARGREFTAEGVVNATPMVLAARLVATGGRFYQVVFIGRKDRADQVDLPLYLGSFTVTK